MKWLEIIELRITKNDYKIIESYFGALKKDVRDKKIQNIMIFSKLNLDTDFSIHILHTTADLGTQKSELGQYLVSDLKDFGLVNHSIWIEMKK
jgi:hypothetical protein